MPTCHLIILEWKVVLESLLFEFTLSCMCHPNFGCCPRKVGVETISGPVFVVRLSLYKLACDHALHINTEDVWVRTAETTLKRLIRAQGLTELRHYCVGCHLREEGGIRTDPETCETSFIPPLYHCFLPSFV